MDSDSETGISIVDLSCKGFTGSVSLEGGKFIPVTQIQSATSLDTVNLIGFGGNKESRKIVKGVKISVL